MKAILFILTFAACAFAQTPAITCASGTNRVQEGQSITCTSSSPVNVTLTGTGTLGGTLSNTTSWTYTAPPSITVNHSMAGCPVMPNDSIFNTRIDNLPVHPSSATWISGVVNGGNTSTYNMFFGELSWGISTSNASTPTKTLLNYYSGSTPNFPMSSGPNLKEEEGNYHSLISGNDHHIMNVRTDNCQFYEVYNMHTPTFPFAAGCLFGGSGCNAQSSVGYNWSDYTPFTGAIGGTDAAGLPLAPLTMHLSEFYNGAITHPVRFTSCQGCIYNQTVLWPAAAPNGSNTPTAPPNGAWFRLRLCGVGGVNTNCATLSSYSAYQQIILTGLHNYGAILSDNGSVLAVTPGTDISLDRNVLAAVDALGIPIIDFDVVDASSLQYAANSYETCPLNKTCVGGQNTYETPANQAIIVATPAGGGTAVATPIAIQGVTIGLNAPTLWMEAGSYTYQIPSWVTGTSNQTVNWSLVSGPGSVTSGGVYTPPAGVPPTLGSPANAPNPGAVLEMGVKFKADTTGYVTGVRFYKTSGQTGTHIGRLWSCGDQTTCATGTQLASATFTSETASGWQDVRFSSPVAITANTYYVASYTAPDGSISYVQGGLLAGADNSPLHFPADGTAGHNGVFGGAAGAFPNGANPTEYNWCVDLDFQETLGGTTYNMYSGSTTAVLKATSAADSNAKAYEYIYLLPPGSNPTNSIRIDSGNYSGSPFTDGNGNVWQSEGGLENASPGCCGGDSYPGWQNFLSNPEIGVYQTVGYGGGSVNDMQYSFIVPNGNYKVRAMYGSSGGGASPFGATISTSASGINAYRLHLETQGNIELHNFNPFLNGPAGYAWELRVPTDAYVPAKVTNNVLNFDNRAVYYDADLLWNGLCQGCGPTTAINGVEIIPDSTPAHWAIDTQQQSTVTAGSHLWSTQSLGTGTEFGTAFIPTQNGYIAGVRFYKGTSDIGTHTGTLWLISSVGAFFNSQNGTALATGTFTGETASGWQTLTFSSPVAVTAGLQYVVSYHNTTGNVYRAATFFTNPLTQPFINGPLESFMGVSISGSGGAFPNAVTNTLFAVDPIFSLSSSGTNPVTLFPTSGLPGQQLQFYVEDWYTGVNDPTWSIVSGPGTIQAGIDYFGNPVGIYTAPWTQPSAGSAVVVKAQSQSNPAISAMTTLYFNGTTNGVAK